MSRGLIARIAVGSFVLLLVAGLIEYRTSAFPSHPLSKSDLLSLVAGKVVPENVAFEIRSRGLNFAPDLAYNGLLKQAGADSRVFAVLSSAKTSTAANSPDESAEMLRHLANAGRFLRQDAPEAAAKELNIALATSSARSQIGFVMGDVLIAQGDPEQALRVYHKFLMTSRIFPKCTLVSATAITR
jgi:hypothetical protein